MSLTKDEVISVYINYFCGKEIVVGDSKFISYSSTIVSMDILKACINIDERITPCLVVDKLKTYKG